MNTTGNSTQLNNLEPYSVYSVEVFAFNSFHSSQQSRAILMDTKGLGYFEKEEDLENLLITRESTEISASFSFKNIQCNKLRGPLYFSIEYRCASKWCKDIRNKSLESFGGTLDIKSLQPYCEYKFDILFCRNETICEKFKGYINKNFTTKATVPNPLTDFSVFATGDTFISLRWLPPYPPTGTLGSYKIITKCTNCRYSREKYNLIQLAENCSIWQEYKCYKITNGLEYGKEYSLEIQAYNTENYMYSKIAYVANIAVYEKTPEKPYNLFAIWNLNNTLDLFWNHPNKTNGILHSFIIEVTANRGDPNKLRHLVDSVFTEKLIYHYTISDPLPSAMDLTIQIYSQNNYGTSEAAEIYESSYPGKPEFNRSQISITNYTETTISLSMEISQVRLNNSLVEQYAFILIDDVTSDVKDPNVEILEKKINSTFNAKSRLRVLNEFNLKQLSTNMIDFIIGDEKELTGNKILPIRISPNKPLQKATYYNVTFIILNGYKGKYRHTLHEVRGLTGGNPEMTPPPPERKEGVDKDNSGGNAAYALLLLLLLIPIIIVVIIKRKNIVFVRPTISLEKILESSSRILPPGKESDESIPLAVKDTIVRGHKPVMKVKPKLSIRKSTNPPNIPPNLYSKPVVMADFEEYVKTSIESGELERQHALFPRGQTQPWEYGSSKINKPKNRYNNLVAYDHSRVILEKLAGDENSDYINANYIHGYNIERAYIATQGPKTTTLTDFWRMIWQENVRHIVMLANVLENGKKKVEQYWPNINEEMTFDDIIVQYQSMELFANFEYRIFLATKGEETRKISQLHFTTWPDHGVPLYPQSLVPFLRKFLKIQLSSTSPIVVHCSAGVGRTGTVLLADMSLRMAAKQGVVDLLSSLQKLREQRPNMVDNVEQYKLAHLVVLESLMGLRTSIPCNEDLDKVVQKLIIDEDYRIQMNYLKETQWQDQAMNSVAECNEEFPNYPEKNRIQEIIPENQGRIFVSRYPHDDESSSYINAVQVDGFRCPGRFFITQQPMPNTVGDFWRVVAERKINVILSLNEIDLKERTCCKYWPTADEPELQPVDFLIVKFGSVTELQYYNIYSVHLWIKNRREKEKLNVEIVAFKGWQAKTTIPSCCEEFLSFYEEADAISRRSTHVIVTCFDGATACGVYVALSFIIEQMKLEHECDVCLAVRSIRHNRTQFITNENQFLFLYECAVKFINGFQSYANFQNQ